MAVIIQLHRMRFLFLLIFVSNFCFSQSIDLFIGTYTNTGSKGIYVYSFDTKTGKATWKSNTDGVMNPSFLSQSSNGKFVYAVNETGGADSGKVSAFSFNKTTGKLSLINQQNSGGDHPCHIVVDKKNRWVFVSNYTGGSLSAFKTNEDGSLKPYAQHIQNAGTSIVKPNQERAHVHGSFFGPGEKHLFVTDLGIDKLLMYAYDPSASIPLKELEPSKLPSQPGSGPRHMTFHPNEKFAYVIEELSGTVAAYKYQDGLLTQLQRISSHPNRYMGKIASADIHISPDGRFLYASNRGDANTIAIYSIDKKTGLLVTVGFQSTQGKAPRNFAIDPTGNYLIVANQDSDNIVIFKRNKKTGKLSQNGNEINIPKPVCLIFSK